MVIKKRQLPAWLVWVIWVMASATGAVIVIGTTMVVLTGIPSINETQWFIFIAVPAFSILIPILHWLVAKEYLPPLGFWLVGSILGGVIGAILTSFASGFVYSVLEWRPATVILAAIFWLCLGTAQCLMLCSTYKKYGMWTIANVLGGVVLALIIGRSIGNAIDAVIIGALPAIFTGFGIIAMIRWFDAGKTNTQTA